MPRYIDADALAKVLNITEECKDCAYHWGTHNGGFFCGKSSEFTNACEAIFDAPTADVVPVKHGKWIYHDDGGMRYDEYQCSVCRKSFTVDAERIDDICFVIDDLKYCPNCGAEMTEENDG